MARRVVRPMSMHASLRLGILLGFIVLGCMAIFPSRATRVPYNFYGHNLEFTRHDLYEGLSAEMLANRKFATLPGQLGSWPPVMQQLVSSGLAGKVPRWTNINMLESAGLVFRLNSMSQCGNTTSALVSGDVGHSIRCTYGANAASYCGVEQRGWLDGFHSAGQSYGSSISLDQTQNYAKTVGPHRHQCKSKQSPAQCIPTLGKS